MSVQRSPPTNSLLPATSASTTRAGSQPDLSKLGNPNMDTQITYRKRKKPELHECECSNDLKEMRSEMSRISSLLEKYTGSHEQVLQKMQESITEIKNQISDMKSSNEHTINVIQQNVDKVITEINDIKLSTSSLQTEQKNTNSHVARLENSITLSENRVKSLETDLNNLKQSSYTTPVKPENQLCFGEQIIQEFQNRNTREKNIILVGLPEPTSTKLEERMAKDEADVLNIISTVSADIPNPIKIFRIGKYDPRKNRSIKVCFDVAGPAKQLLRNKGSLSKEIRMFSDQTPNQINFLKSLQEELKLRERKGEEGLTIKYINGAPKIVQLNAKNYKQ